MPEASSDVTLNSAALVFGRDNLAVLRDKVVVRGSWLPISIDALLLLVVAGLIALFKLAGVVWDCPGEAGAEIKRWRENVAGGGGVLGGDGSRSESRLCRGGGILCRRAGLFAGSRSVSDPEKELHERRGL